MSRDAAGRPLSTSQPPMRKGHLEQWADSRLSLCADPALQIKLTNSRGWAGWAGGGWGMRKTLKERETEKKRNKQD